MKQMKRNGTLRIRNSTRALHVVTSQQCVFHYAPQVLWKTLINRR